MKRTIRAWGESLPCSWWNLSRENTDNCNRCPRRENPWSLAKAFLRRRSLILPPPEQMNSRRRAFTYLPLYLNRRTVGLSMEPMPFGFLEDEAAPQPVTVASPARKLLGDKPSETRSELRFYGALLMLFALFSVGLFFFFAYHAFGGVGLLVGASVFLAGLGIFATFVLHF